MKKPKPGETLCEYIDRVICGRDTRRTNHAHLFEGGYSRQAFVEIGRPFTGSPDTGQYTVFITPSINLRMS